MPTDPKKLAENLKKARAALAQKRQAQAYGAQAAYKHIAKNPPKAPKHTVHVVTAGKPKPVPQVLSGPETLQAARDLARLYRQRDEIVARILDIETQLLGKKS